MEKAKLKASIIIRAYNAEATIARAIESALAQNFPREQYEIIIVDDGSTDGTSIVIARYANGPRIRVITQANSGITKAANVGIEAARGIYTTFLDADDTFEPQLLSALVPLLDANEHCALVYSDYWEERAGKRRRISPPTVFQALNGGILFRKSVVVETGGYRDVPVFPDYDLFIRMLERWRAARYEKQPLWTYVRHEGSMTADPARVQHALQELRRLHPDKLDLIESIRRYE